MNWITIATFAQVFVVAVSVGFVWYQLRQQTKLARVANTQAQVALVSPFKLLIAQNKEMAKLWTIGSEDWDALDDEGKQQYKSMLTWWLIFYENIFFQGEKGLLEPDIFAAWKNDLDAFIQARLVEKYWADVSKKYHPGFVEYLNARIHAKVAGSEILDEAAFSNNDRLTSRNRKKIEFWPALFWSLNLFSKSLPHVGDPQFEQKFKLWQARRDRWEFALKTGTALLLVVTAIVAVFQYRSQQRQLIRQNEDAQQQRIKDFNLTIYRTRLDIYLEATDTLSKFVYANDQKEADKAEQRFWELYDGKFSVIEDEDAKSEIILAGDFLLEWEKCKTIPVPFLFQDLAYDFTQSCRRSLKTDFPTEFDPLTAVEVRRSARVNPLTAGEATHPAHITRAMIQCVCNTKLPECSKSAK
jgi:hypothetical protein